MRNLLLSSAFFILIFSLPCNAQQTVRLKAGMIITHSVKLSSETYHLNANSSLQKPLLIIEGKNIVIDFDHAILEGSNGKAQPDEFYGLAVLIRKGSKNITLKNAAIHGYKVAVMADSVDHLVVEDCDLSYNYRQHLHSNRDREDISDWMSYHHNENDEWLRYGAALYLKNCKSAVIRNNMITGGQCALMMTCCEKAEVYANDLSFNSGIGIGMYRSSNNTIYNNRLDFNVRGYSHGKYYRGQDSAGILVFEQCNNNLFAYNSATHSGDGFFLWAGQHTMDTGEGGCNDNMIYGNDFSYAPTNGIEVTFSRNIILKNILRECDNGIWGGYSFQTYISENIFTGNTTAIAIEHGQRNRIEFNEFIQNKTAIKLWSRSQQPADWIYAQKRDTRSVAYDIISNHFDHNQVVYDMMGTDSINLMGNDKKNSFTIFKLGKNIKNIDSSDESKSVDVAKGIPDKRLMNLKVAKYPATSFPRGRDQMRITEWGPYDFRYPILWLTNIDSDQLYHFDILGPKGNWKAKQLNGFRIVEENIARFPSSLTAKKDSSIEDAFIRLEYTGEAFKDVFGKSHVAGQASDFDYHEFIPKVKWDIRFYQWDAAHDPNKDFNLFTAIFKQQPVYSTTSNKVDYTWWGAIGKNLPADSFATVATATFDLPVKEYEIGITADDLVKLFIDGKEVINAWDSKYTANDEDTHHHIRMKLGGKHNFKIIHAENAGLATLMFYLEPVQNP